ncbi:MAG TPA: glycosyltransferase family 4 protein [Verrucomicrobiae bacterium]
MKKTEAIRPRTVLVADAAGHILERIARTWCVHGRGREMEVVLSEEASLPDCCGRGVEAGGVHWLDRRRASRAAAVAQCPQVVTIYHHLPGEEAETGRMARDVDVVTAGSLLWQERLQKLTGQRVWLMPQSVDTEWFRPEPEKKLKQREAGLPGEALVVGFVGKAGANVADRKGTDVFLQVMMAWAQKRPTVVVLTGTGWEEFAVRLRGHGMQVVRRSYDDCNATREAYGLMDVLLVTAREEGGPATVLEAMACGVPVVASRVGHVPEVIREGETGFLAGAGDVGAYLTALERLVREEGLSERLQREGRALMVRERDDRVLIPQIDFAGIGRAAQERFAQRSEEELGLRQQRLRWLRWRQKLAGWMRGSRD